MLVFERLSIQLSIRFFATKFLVHVSHLWPNMIDVPSIVISVLSSVGTLLLGIAGFLYTRSSEGEASLKVPRPFIACFS